jgi:hypothetical protein
VIFNYPLVSDTAFRLCLILQKAKPVATQKLRVLRNGTAQNDGTKIDRKLPFTNEKEVYRGAPLEGAEIRVLAP